MLDVKSMQVPAALCGPSMQSGAAWRIMGSLKQINGEGEAAATFLPAYLCHNAHILVAEVCMDGCTDHMKGMESAFAAALTSPLSSVLEGDSRETDRWHRSDQSLQTLLTSHKHHHVRPKYGQSSSVSFWLPVHVDIANDCQHSSLGIL